MFEDIGCVTHEIWFDNMQQVLVHKGSFENKQLISHFEALAHDTGFKPITYQAYRTQTKEKIESVAGVVKRQLQACNYE